MPTEVTIIARHDALPALCVRRSLGHFSWSFLLNGCVIVWESGKSATKAQYRNAVPIFEAIRIPIFKLAVTAAQIRPKDQSRKNRTFRTSNEVVLSWTYPYMPLLRLYRLRMTIRGGKKHTEGSIPSLKWVRISSGKRNSVGILQTNWWSRGAMIPDCVVDLEEDS